MGNDDATAVRPPAVAGRFYPGEPAVLGREVDGYLENAAPPPLPGRLVGIIAPHAGYMYSGGVAAYAYRLLEQGQYKTVVVVAPSHRVPFVGASVYLGDAYRTPLGVIEIDGELSRALVDANSLATYVPDAHRLEHSLEVQLPFLQRTVGQFKLVAVVMGRGDTEQCMSLARDIAELTGPRGALLVASTDLSHYHPQDEAVGLDAEVLRLVEQFDPEGLITAIQKGECEACGALPMATVMMAARELGATGAQVLRYATSGDVAGDRSAVVGYMAAAMYAEADGQGSPEEWPLLSPEAREELLRMARATLTNYLTDGTIPHFEASSDELRSHRGVFVTLTIGGRLRGCIGHHEPDTPLNRLVPEMAVAAGFRDPRFPPLTEAELPDVHIKVSSYLTPVYSIRSPDEYEVGVHGIILEKQGRASTFLPEVPVEQGWDRDTTLRHLCAKAGLPPDAWQEGCTFRVYKTQVFEEAR